MTATTPLPAGLAALPPVDLLRLALRLDAVATAAVGVAAAAGSRVLDGALGLPADVLLGVGVFLLGWAALVVFASGGPVRVGLARLIGFGNAAWVLASVATAVLVADLTALGVGLVLAQALAVAGFAALQLATVRRCPPRS